MPFQHERGKYPVGTVVRLKKTGEFAIIVDKAYLKDEKEFLNYYANIEGRADGRWALYDGDFELECLPPTT
ncbi:hypothetical protein [Chryseolinea lacunae]|uniref:Uncharacterized protein n=1 Tax=Chryseolinea lacunae TaxID=2801331 RepID=A0ABS1KPG2_9BACT|nr:hypothetical protein [Chryseolinea lacunae]MBL0741363.1 hypothetical protein [Chryseolinea lacunae]